MEIGHRGSSLFTQPCNFSACDADDVMRAMTDNGRPAASPSFSAFKYRRRRTTEKKTQCHPNITAERAEELQKSIGLCS
jgi:hypothetical protein